MGPALRLAFAIFALALPISAASAQKEPLGGQPARGAKPSVADLEEQLVYQRAFEAVIWSQPLIGLYGITRALREVGIADNEILAMSRPATTRHELITANNTTPYIAATSNLRNGPMVLEVPPQSPKGVLFGQVVDAWQDTIVGVGPSGSDQGKGGKYLFVPPNYSGALPDGYIAIRSPTFSISFAFRSIKLPGMSDADAQAYARTLKLYPLSEAANPKPTRFADTWDKPFRSLPFYDFRYYQELYEALKDEPVYPRDKAMMGMLKTIGIEAGKPFTPPMKYKAAMERAVVDAYFYMQDRWLKVQAKNLYWADRHWSWNFLPDENNSFNYDTKAGLFYTERSDTYHPGTYLPARVPRLDKIADWLKAGNPPPATVYLVPTADDKGRPLAAGKLYKLRVPADMPVKQFWALIVYDFDTWAFIYNPLDLVGLSTYDTDKMKKSADGSVDVYFGPKAPKGLEQTGYRPKARSRCPSCGSMAPMSVSGTAPLRFQTSSSSSSGSRSIYLSSCWRRAIELRR